MNTYHWKDALNVGCKHKVDEPTAKETITILGRHPEKYEDNTTSIIQTVNIEAAIFFQTAIQDRFPPRAIDLLDEAGSRWIPTPKLRGIKWSAFD